MYSLFHPYTKKPFLPNIHHKANDLVENQEKLASVVKGGSIGNSNLILGASNPKLKPKKMEESQPLQNINFDKMKPLKRGGAIKRNNIRLVL
jgi:hypothetical protein